MPKAKKLPAPVQPVAPTPPPAPAPAPAALPSPTGEDGNVLPVLYPTIEITERSMGSEFGPLDIAYAKEALGWETEKEFQVRMVAEKGGKPEHYVFGDLGIRCADGGVIPVHCTDLAGQKVVTKHNAHNRPFDKDWCESLIHTILYGQWAGPFTAPGETINGETIRISRYGRVLSGQHQLTALVLAGEWLAKARENKTDHPDKPKYPVWREHGAPFIETITIKGLSEDPRILMSIDYVKPRNAADVFYTSEVFKSCTSVERKELCRMLASAVDMLWTRTDARGYRTHPEIVGFLDRHKRLLDCVLHLYAENSVKANRKISKLRLSGGHCAALMYVQASSGPRTDGDVYRNEEPPTERNLDWSLWDRAEEFWTLLAGGKDFQLVRMALARLVDSTPANEDNQGLGGRGPEKLAVLAMAWERWRDHSGNGAPFDEDDLGPDGCLCLHYTDLDEKGKQLPNGMVDLIECADFYGIDTAPKRSGKAVRSEPPEMPPPSKEDMDRMYADNEERRRQQNMTDHQRKKEAAAAKK